MKKSKNLFRNILRIFGTMSAIFYVLFLFDLSFSQSASLTFADLSPYLLFVVFILGYFFLWKHELISGIVLIAWHGLQWCLVIWVWVDGELTLIFGFPIAILGILLVIYGIRKRLVLISTI